MTCNAIIYEVFNYAFGTSSTFPILSRCSSRHTENLFAYLRECGLLKRNIDSENVIDYLNLYELKILTQIHLKEMTLGHRKGR